MFTIKVVTNYKTEFFNGTAYRMRNFITTAKSVVKAAALPTLGLDAADIDVSTVGGFIKLDATLKDDDNSADVTIETISGVRKIKVIQSSIDNSKQIVPTYVLIPSRITH